VTLRAVGRAIRRRWWVVAACVLATAAAALALAAGQAEKYEASASLLFGDANIEQTLLGEPSSRQSSDPQRESATNVELGALDVVAERAAARLRVPGLTGSDVSDQVNISTNRDSDLISVEATASDPRLAARMANVFAQEVVALRRRTDQGRVQQALREVRRELAGSGQRTGPGGTRLRQQEQRLQVLASVRTGNVEIVQRAQPDDTPVAPRPKRNVLVGAVLGLMIAVALVFLLEQIDRRLRDEQDVEDALGLPIVARIPESRKLRRAGSWRDLALPAAEAEAFRMLRANLRYFDFDRTLRSLAVVSAGQDEGKSAISWNLALAEVQAGRTVLLLEADLRRPTLAGRLELPQDVGLSLVLAGVSGLEESALALPSANGALDVIPAGPPPPNPAELLESRTMGELLEDVTERYDLVIVDTPPALRFSDATPLVAAVSGALLAVRLGQSVSDDVKAVAEQLEGGGGRLLGVVVSGGRSPRAFNAAYSGVPEGAGSS
jgi:capsular exopolysaccharide synthesis family protein